MVATTAAVTADRPAALPRPNAERSPRTSGSGLWRRWRLAGARGAGRVTRTPATSAVTTPHTTRSTNPGTSATRSTDTPGCGSITSTGPIGASGDSATAPSTAPNRAHDHGGRGGDRRTRRAQAGAGAQLAQQPGVGPARPDRPPPDLGREAEGEHGGEGAEGRQRDDLRADRPLDRGVERARPPVAELVLAAEPGPHGLPGRFDRRHVGAGRQAQPRPPVGVGIVVLDDVGVLGEERGGEEQALQVVDVVDHHVVARDADAGDGHVGGPGELEGRRRDQREPHRVAGTEAGRAAERPVDEHLVGAVGPGQAALDGDGLVLVEVAAVDRDQCLEVAERDERLVVLVDGCDEHPGVGLDGLDAGQSLQQRLGRRFDVEDVDRQVAAAVRVEVALVGGGGAAGPGDGRHGHGAAQGDDEREADVGAPTATQLGAHEQAQRVRHGWSVWRGRVRSAPGLARHLGGCWPAPSLVASSRDGCRPTAPGHLASLGRPTPALSDVGGTHEEAAVARVGRRARRPRVEEVQDQLTAVVVPGGSVRLHQDPDRPPPVPVAPLW